MSKYADNAARHRGVDLAATELAQVEVAAVLDEGWGCRHESLMRPAITVNGKPRQIYWTNTRVRDALDAYFAERIRLGHRGQLGVRSG